MPKNYRKVGLYPSPNVDQPTSISFCFERATNTSPRPCLDVQIHYTNTPTSGTTSGSFLLQNSGSEENLKQLMEQRKRKRIISNRESARRSRMKKQKRLSDLVTQLSQLKKENNQIIASLSATTQHCINVEAENSVLIAQVVELSHRLQSLNEIISFSNGSCGVYGVGEPVGEFISDSLSYVYVNQPLMASADMMY